MAEAAKAEGNHNAMVMSEYFANWAEVPILRDACHPTTSKQEAFRQPSKPFDGCPGCPGCVAYGHPDTKQEASAVDVDGLAKVLAEAIDKARGEVLATDDVIAMICARAAIDYITKGTR